jgi:hypothetical protein
MTAELYGPSVVWTGIGTWWLIVVGWLMFMVGWSRSRIERDILLRREDEEFEEMEENNSGVVSGASVQETKMTRDLSSPVDEDEEEGLLRDDSSTTGSEEGVGGRKGRRTPRYRKVDVEL